MELLSNDLAIVLQIWGIMLSEVGSLEVPDSLW